MNKAVATRGKDKLKMIDIEDIIVGERYRKDLGNIEELAASILDKGVLQPITLSSSLELLAGGRRYQACVKAQLKQIPALIRETDGEVDAREVELIENTFRKDFTWDEEAALVLEIDRLYREKDYAWSGRKTAQLLDKSVGSVANSIQLAKACEVLPELKTFKTADEAMKVLKKMEEGAITAELSRRQTVEVNAPDNSPSSMKRGIKDALKLADANYMIGDVFKIMQGMRSNGKVHIIECDPPYGIDLAGQKGSKDSVDSNVHSYKEVPGTQYAEFLERLTKELYRIANSDCWLIFWFGPTWQQEVYKTLLAAGWQVDEIPAIWSKGQGQTLQPEMYWARTYEPFYLCRKGNPIMMHRGGANVFNFSGTPAAQKYHPTERPVALIEEVLTRLRVGGNHVFVPFLGSGATLRACYNMGIPAFGTDLNDEYKAKFMLKVEEDARRNLDVRDSAANSKDDDLPF